MTDSSEPSAAAGDAGSSWYCQLGPEVSGPCMGAVMGPSAFFLVMPFGDDSQIYAQASPDGGGTWQAIPNNDRFELEGDNLVCRLDPMGTSLKFLIGPID
jgi:hypothetical protein